MIVQARLLFFFAAVLLYDNAYAAPVNDDVVITAKVNGLFDNLIPVVRKFMRENGMEPMDMQDFSAAVVPLPGELKGNINFHNGFLHNLSKVKRSRNVIASYLNKHLLIDMNLGWRILEFNYAYDFKYLFVKREGDVYGRFYDIDVNVVVSLDLKNYEIKLDKIKFSKVGDFTLELHGHLVDPILNVISNAVTTIFRSKAVEMVEQKLPLLLQPLVDQTNVLLKKLIKNHELDYILNINQ